MYGSNPEEPDEMKNFLKGHWEHVTQASGQPFGYKLMEREDFNYDTEPSCRAVVAARPLVGMMRWSFLNPSSTNSMLIPKIRMNWNFTEAFAKSMMLTSKNLLIDLKARRFAIKRITSSHLIVSGVCKGIRR